MYLGLAQSLIDQTKNMLDLLGDHKDGIAAARDLVEILFMVGGGSALGGIGYFATKKFLKGQSPDLVEPKEGVTHIHIGDNYIKSNPKAAKLLDSPSVGKAASDLVSTLDSEKGSIERIRIKHSYGRELAIEREEVNYFCYEDVEEVLREETKEMILEIISLSFKEGNKWRVTADGAAAFSVTIDDEEFLTKIGNHEISFSKGDCLVCKVHEVQCRTSSGLRKDRTITKVLRHEPKPQQLPLK